MRTVVSLIAVTAVLAGCGGTDGEELQQWMSEQRSRTASARIRLTSLTMGASSSEAAPLHRWRRDKGERPSPLRRFAPEPIA